MTLARVPLVVILNIRYNTFRMVLHVGGKNNVGSH